MGSDYCNSNEFKKFNEEESDLKIGLASDSSDYWRLFNNSWTLEVVSKPSDNWNWGSENNVLFINGILPVIYGLQEIEELPALEPEIQVRETFSHTPNHTPMPREGEVKWTDFAKDLCDQFGEKNMINVMQEFNKLR